jgi:uncharacterized lipoprotein YehR (DUF1307 family)
MKKSRLFTVGMLVLALVFGLVLTGCGDKNSGSPLSPSDNNGNNTDNNGNDNNGNNNNGNNNNGNDNNGNDNNGNDNNGDNGSAGGDNTFTPPTKAQLSAFLESHRTNPANKISGENAAVYIRSITVNTYTIDGTSITTNPAAVPENADVEVKFTIRTILGFNQLTMGERLNIDNYRIDLMDALESWLKQQGFKDVPSITTGNTIFG